MTEANARFQGSIPELYDRHLGPVIFEPYAEDLARRVIADAPQPFSNWRAAREFSPRNCAPASHLPTES